MARITVSVNGDPIAPIFGRMKNLRPAFVTAVKAWRALVAQEFAQEAWRPRSGPFRAWKPVEAFGSREAPEKILDRTGALRRAWLGVGAGSLERITDEMGEFGVSQLLLPYAHVHRGEGEDVSAAASRQPFKIRVTTKMRYYLGLTYGVWLRASTTEISIPRRPHATTSPELKTRVNAIFNAHIAGREVPASVLS